MKDDQSKEISAEPIVHKGVKRLALYFEYRKDLDSYVRKLPEVRWSQTLSVWHIPDTDENRDLFNFIIRPIGLLPGKIPLTGKIPQKSQQYIETFVEWMQSQRYSEKTVQVYCKVVVTFLRYMGDKTIQDINNEDITEFNKQYIIRNNYSISYQNQVVNGIKLFFRTVEKKKILEEEIERPRKELKLPAILSQDEVESIINSCTNIKHKTMLALMYACGLRRGELINLTLKSIDSKRKLLIIKQAKGRRDRVVPIPERMIEMLRSYYKLYKPKEWLFEGDTPGERYAESSLWQVFDIALKKTMIS